MISLRTSALLATLTLAPFVCLAAASGNSKASGTNGAVSSVDFVTDVWPIIETSCLECHDSRTAFSNLRLDSPEKIMKGGDLGLVVVAGKPDESPLVTRVALPMEDLDFMPIEGDPLTEEQIETLRKWIEEGADFGEWTGVEE